MPPEVALQLPEQQSPARAHTSPGWMQNDDAMSQTPLLHSFEQHSLLPAHVLPDVLHEVLSAVQVPPPQVPLAQSPLLVHAVPSEAAGVAEQVPLLQFKLAQSVATAQLVPAGARLLK